MNSGLRDRRPPSSGAGENVGPASGRTRGIVFPWFFLFPVIFILTLFT